MCHNLLQDPNFLRWLVRIDQELAAPIHAEPCPCGGIRHRANYPRKPRGCPPSIRDQFASRLSFCCNRCRKRATAPSVRFLGRRVYLALVVVMKASRLTAKTPGAGQMCDQLAIPLRTLQRWRAWWVQNFPLTPLWQARCDRFLPPVAHDELPESLLARFLGPPASRLLHALVFLTPLTVRPPDHAARGSLITRRTCIV